MIVCLTVLLVAAFIVNPKWTIHVLSQLMSYIKNNWAEFRNNKKD